MSHETSLLASYCCPNSAHKRRYLSGMKTDNTHIGHNIRRIRELRGFKQSTLAEDLNLSQQAVSLIENRQRVSQKLLLRIATILSVNPTIIRRFDANHLLDDFAHTFLSSQESQSEIKPNPGRLHELARNQREIAELRQRILELENRNKYLVDRGSSLRNAKPNEAVSPRSDKNQPNRLEECILYSTMERSGKRYVYAS